MQEPPPDLTDAEVLSAVRTAWDGAVSRVVHLPVGFGAHHWRADAAGSPGLFVTYDRFGTRHTADTLAAAYAGAVALADRGLEFVLAPIPAHSGQSLVPAGSGALSCTPWVDGSVVGEGAITDPGTAEASIADLGRLHAEDPPPGLRRWVPMVNADLPDRLAGWLADPWDTGPYGERARTAIAERVDEIGVRTNRLRALTAAADDRPWVVTHGETHTRNQLRTAEGIRFVDWESLALAPRERDLSTLVQAGYGARVGADPLVVELFDTEWRLSEVAEYAAWFAAPHTGSADDEIAYEGLMDELTRGPWWPPTDL